MIINKKIISYLLIGFFFINILLIVFSIQKVDFLDSNELGATLLKEIGLIKRTQKDYYAVPTLSGPDNMKPLQKTTYEDRLNKINTSEQINEILLNNSSLISGNSANNQNPPRIRPPSYSMGGSGDGIVGIYDSAWDSISGTSISVNLNSEGSNLMAIAI